MELLGGAAVGAVFGEILSEVVVQTKRTLAFKKELTKIKTTLEKMEPKVTEITKLSKKLNRPVEELSTIIRLLEDGKKLVVKCSSIGKYNLKRKSSHAKKLTELDNKLSRFFQTEALAIILSINLKILSVVSTPTSRAEGFSGSCSVPGIPGFIVGFDQRLEELKSRLLKDETRVLVVSAPGGYGKTTLAKMLCHDAEIKGKFGDNTLYITVSSQTSLKSIAQRIFKHYNTNHDDFKSEEDAKNQIEYLLRKKGSGKTLLLVLDDVWSESKFVIGHLQFQIPEGEYKILVTSRDSFPEFKYTYDLTKLNAKDAETLFRHYAIASDEIRETDDLMKQM